MSGVLKHDRRLSQATALELRSLDIPLGGKRRRGRMRRGSVVALCVLMVVVAGLLVLALRALFSGDEAHANCAGTGTSQQQSSSILSFIRGAAGLDRPGCARQGGR